MIQLEPMSLEHYISWKQILVKDYAEAKVRAGNVAPEDALHVSEFEFYELFPEGLNTVDTDFYTVVDMDSGQKVGILCVKIRNNRQEMFICDIRIDEQFQGKGYGKQTLRALEAIVRSMGISRISLHMFGDNEIALRLYRSFGFVATNLLMSKVLTD